MTMISLLVNYNYWPRWWTFKLAFCLILFFFSFMFLGWDWGNNEHLMLDVQTLIETQITRCEWRCFLQHDSAK